MAIRGLPWGVMKSGLGPPVTRTRTLDSTGGLCRSVSYEVGDLGFGPRQFDADLPRGPKQPLDVLLDEDDLAAVGAHEIEASVPSQQPQVIDRENRLRVGHELSIDIVDIGHTLRSPRFPSNVKRNYMTFPDS